jgi:23S rRNA (guanosine2251-2'-O)-methyltransferase
MKDEQSIVFGVNAIVEKLRASPDEIVEILLAGEATRGLEAEAERASVRVTHVSRELLDQLASGERHQGVLARVAAFSYWPVGELIDSALSSAPPRLILILDGLTDPRNLGALLRAAEGAGARHVVIPKDRSAPVTPTVIKASAGAAHHMRIYRVTNLRQTMKQLKDRGYWLVGLEVGAETTIYDQTYPERLGIVLGSEGHGMRRLIRQECDFLVSIPMHGKLSSLNVAVAGGVFLYEVLRRDRNQKGVNG